MCRYCGDKSNWQEDTCETCGELIENSKLTPRDHFAIASLQGLLASLPANTGAMTPETLRELASDAPYIIADFMIAKRFKDIKPK